MASRDKAGGKYMFLRILCTEFLPSLWSMAYLGVDLQGENNFLQTFRAIFSLHSSFRSTTAEKPTLFEILDPWAMVYFFLLGRV